MQSLLELPQRNLYTITTNLVPFKFPQQIQNIYFLQYRFKIFHKLTLTAQIKAYLMKKIFIRFPKVIKLQEQVLVSIDGLQNTFQSIKTQYDNIAIEIIISQKCRFRVEKLKDHKINRQNLQIINRYFIKYLRNLQYTTKNNSCYLPLSPKFGTHKNSAIYTSNYQFKWFNDRLFLQIKNEQKQFKEPTFLDELRQQIKQLFLQRLSIQQIYKQINKKYKRKEIITIYGGNLIYNIRFIDFDLNINSLGITEENVNISFKDYYRKRYNIMLKDKKQPLIKVGKNQYLIPELVKLFKEKDNNPIIEIKQTVTNNYQFLKALSYKHPSNILHNLSKLEVELDQKYQIIDTKYLDYPLINVGKEENIDIFSKNTFEFNNKKVYYNKIVLKIYVIIPSQLYSQGISQQITIAAQKIGVEIQLNINQYSLKNRAKDILKDIEALVHSNSIKKQDSRIFWIFIEDHLSNEYARLKTMTLNNNLQEISQITLASTVRSTKRHFETILMQMAAKMRVILWRIPVQKISQNNKKILMIGICCSHCRGAQLILTFCCNISNHMTKYFSQFSLEIKDIHTLSNKMLYIVKKCLEQYQKRNRYSPKEIIILRKQNFTRFHSNIQLNQVREALKIRNQEVYSHIKLTYYMISKQNKLHTYWIKDIDNISICKNGTFIDKHIVDNDSFYLLYQTTIKNLVNHIYYRNILKQSSLQNKQLIKLMYNQSFNYFNFTGSVEIPGVLQYAHKLSRMMLDIKMNGELCLENMRNHLYFL